MGIVGRPTALMLVAALSLPVPVPAAGEESAPVTLNGRSLSAGPLSGLLQGQVLGTAEGVWRQSEGRISGVLQDETGRPLANQRVELARPSRDGSGRFVTTTDIRGAFSYVGLEPGRYEVLYRVDGEIVARSGPLDLVAGAMQLSGVALRADPGRGRGLHPAVWVGIAAAAIMAAAALTCFVADTDRCRR